MEDGQDLDHITASQSHCIQPEARKDLASVDSSFVSVQPVVFLAA